MALIPNYKIGEHTRPRVWLDAPSHPASEPRIGYSPAYVFLGRNISGMACRPCWR